MAHLNFLIGFAVLDYLFAKFDNVPVEKDTRILFKKTMNLGEYDVLYEIFSWDGVNAESIIFADDDIIGLEDSEIGGIVKKNLNFIRKTQELH